MAGALIFGIVYSTILLYFKLDGIFTLIPVLITLSACILVAIFRRKGSEPIIFFAVCVFILVGAIYTFARGEAFGVAEVPLNGATKITGRVTATGVTANGVRYAVLSGAEAGGTRLKGKVIAYLSENGGNYFQVGYRLTFFSQLELNDLVEYGEIHYYATINCKYRCFVAGELTADYRFSLFGEIYTALERTLTGNLDRETASVCLALITGNTDGISAATLTAFRNGGVAHVFAVSGLHVGVIFAGLTAIFKKLRVNRIASAVIRVSVLVFYAGVCGFSASSVRAVVMCAVAVLSTCFMRKNDSLNSLALSAILLLLINPFSLYDVGFALSYGAVLGILLLSRNLQRLLFFLPSFARKPVAAGLAVQFGTIPTMLTAFKTVSVAGLFLNVVILPFAALIYIMVLVGTILGAIFPQIAGAVLHVCALPIHLIINLIAEGGLADAVVTAEVSRLVYLPFIAVIIALTGKLNLRALPRGALFFTATTLMTLGLIVSSPSVMPTATFSAGYGGGSVMLRSQAGTVLVITSDFEPRSAYHEQIDALVVVAQDDHLPAINLIDGEVDRVYLCGGALPMPWRDDDRVICSDSFVACGVHFTFENTVLFFDFGGSRFSVQRDYLGDMYGAIDKNCQYILYSYHNYDAVLYTPSGDFNLAKCGDARYELHGGKLRLASVLAKENNYEIYSAERRPQRGRKERLPD